MTLLGKVGNRCPIAHTPVSVTLHLLAKLAPSGPLPPLPTAGAPPMVRGTPIPVGVTDRRTMPTGVTVLLTAPVLSDLGRTGQR